MVELGCGLDMMLLWVFAIISLELMALLLGLRSTGGPKMTQCTMNIFNRRFNLSYLSCLWSYWVLLWI